MMAEDFDPDAFLSAHEPKPALGADRGQDFDPDAFLSQHEQPREDLSWSDVPGQAVRNLPHSALEFGKAVAQPFMHPIETAGNLAAIGSGVIQHLGLGSADPGETEDKDTATAAGKFLMDRYGSVEGIKKTLATDPVGVAGDLSTVLTGGGAAASRIPGVAGKVGEVASAAGRYTDPVSAVTGTAKLLGRGTAGMLGVQTGTGSQPIREAAAAGFEGGERARAFRENITGVAPTEEGVSDAKRVIDKMRQQRGEAYREGMADVAKDPTVLDWDKIDNALADTTAVKTYKGIPLDESTQAIRQKIGQTVAEWKTLPEAEYHTVEGMDALKQKIGSIRDATQYGTPERVVADKAYHAIRGTITEQAPEYARVMKGYEEASRQVKVIEKELSLGKNANIDTSLRKLQSVLRNNVNTSFGRRKELAQFLVDNGAPHLMSKLAGQALQPWAPRGLGRLAQHIGLDVAEALGIGAAAGAGTGGMGAAVLPALAASSPRLVGEAAYWGGTAARPLKYLPSRETITAPAFQLGRITSPEHFKQGGRVTRSFRYKY